MSRRIDPIALVLVAGGGALGVAARAAITAPVADPGAVFWVTFAINGVGCLLLGIVVGWAGHRRVRLRAFLGTGILGGFTTYSAFAVETVVWLTTPWLAAALAAASVLAGLCGAVAGLFIGRRIAGTPGVIELPEDAE